MPFDEVKRQASLDDENIMVPHWHATGSPARFAHLPPLIRLILDMKPVQEAIDDPRINPRIKSEGEGPRTARIRPARRWRWSRAAKAASPRFLR
jgi:hypothetical protein